MVLVCRCWDGDDFQPHSTYLLASHVLCCVCVCVGMDDFQPLSACIPHAVLCVCVCVCVCVGMDDFQPLSACIPCAVLCVCVCVNETGRHTIYVWCEAWRQRMKICSNTQRLLFSCLFKQVVMWCTNGHTFTCLCSLCSHGSTCKMLGAHSFL